MKESLLIFGIFTLSLSLAGCVSTRESYTQEYNQCEAQKKAGMSEIDYAVCLNQALTKHGPYMGYSMHNINSYNKDRFSIAENIDAKKISNKEAENKYIEAGKNFYDRHRVYSAQKLEEERIQNEIRRNNYEEFLAQQRHMEQQKQYAQDCIQRYEESMPKEYDTRCYGSASPEGRNVTGYQNCTTSEKRRSAPSYVVKECYDKIKNNNSF